MENCESDGQSETKTTRVRYTRAEILEVKKNPISSAEFANEFSRINASILRSTRGRARLNSLSKSQAGEKPRDTSNIVLGPQKRTWNTGCHVSQQTPGREATDTSTSARWPKFAVEHRTPDKHHPKAVGDYKRDYRCNDSRGSGYSSRGRGSARQLEGLSYVKNHNKEDRFGREYRTSNSHSEDEPEWFSEGPTTVNDTIELGGILEESLDCENNLVAKTSDRMDFLPREIDGDKPGKTEGIVADTPDSESSASKSTVFPENANKVSSGGADHHENENRGSRFKHLFQKNEQSDENVRPSSTYPHNTAPLNNINEQLLNLLKVKPSGLSNIEQNLALQAENKLRSILFGNSSIPSSNTEQTKNDLSESKRKVYTVEEIEAEMRSGISRPTDKTVGSLPQISDPLLINDQAIKSRGNPIGFPKNLSHTSQSESTASWVPFLRSLVGKQNPKPVSSQPMDMQSSISPFGLLPNSMANAVSASARINQLQHPDIPLNSASDVNSTPQGFLYQLRNGTRDPAARSRPQLHSPVLYPGMYRLQPPNAFSSAPPGRPIVKSQQNAFSSHNSGRTNNPICGNNQNSVFVNSSIQQETNRQSVNMNLRQYLNNIETDLLNNSPASLSSHRQNYGNSFPLYAPTTTLASSIPFNPHLQQQAKANDSPANNGSLSLLSQLLELEKLKQPSGVDSNFSGIKAKTLEEIEQLESPKNNILF
uniref:Eukaryotic translation initiation factor 4E transporter n=1 Tax=Trichobilharzia regenti TaxID=157069 RepID=A0AA85K8D8_TRIRE|nr:unnamed protein product [Trichobilharzia regenti]